MRILFHLFISLGLSSAATAQQPADLSASVQPYVDRSELAGAVMLVANRERVLTIQSAGWANVGERKPMRTDSMFWIASQSKPITAAALMMLVDDGQVRLTDNVEKFLPEFAAQMVVVERTKERVVLKNPKRPITVRDILSHCSGMPFSSALEKPTLDLLPLEARVRSYSMTPLNTQPGTKYRYSNAGINTAARIIEVVAKMSFEDFLDQRLFQPLGMKDTTFWPTEKQVARIALSYKPGPKKKGLMPLDITQLHYPLTDLTKRQPMPAGGLFATADDIARFYRMILNEGQLDGRRYLSKDAVRQLTTKQTPAGIKNGYGLGFSIGKGQIGHGCAYSTRTNIETESGLILVWLVQHAGFPGDGKKSQDAFRKAALGKYSR